MSVLRAYFSRYLFKLETLGEERKKIGLLLSREVHWPIDFCSFVNDFWFYLDLIYFWMKTSSASAWTGSRSTSFDIHPKTDLWRNQNYSSSKEKVKKSKKRKKIKYKKTRSSLTGFKTVEEGSANEKAFVGTKIT